MSGYAGSEAQIELMRRSDDHAEWTRTTRGACNVGRMLGCDDIEQIGWPTILDALQRGGSFGFRLLSLDAATAAAAELQRHGYRLDMWDVFVAGRSEAASQVDAIFDSGLPPGMSWLDIGADPDGAAMRSVQAFMLANGVVPFSGSMLLGRYGPARTLAIADADGTVVASACTYLPHNATSVHARKAWGGLVAVDPSQRGRKLGVLINAAMVKAAFEELAAEGIYELVSSSNMPSRRMVEACGLRHDPAVVSGVATTADGTRYTK